MLDFFAKLLRRSDSSKDQAKERLRLVLVHDRASLSPGLLESLKEDLMEVLERYLEVDEPGLDVTLDHDDDSVALVANIPVRRVKRRKGPAGSSAPPAAAEEADPPAADADAAVQKSAEDSGSGGGSSAEQQNRSVKTGPAGKPHQGKDKKGR